MGTVGQRTGRHPLKNSEQTLPGVEGEGGWHGDGAQPSERWTGVWRSQRYSAMSRAHVARNQARALSPSYCFSRETRPGPFHRAIVSRRSVIREFGHVEGPRRAKPGQGPFTELLFLAVVPEMERKGYGRAMLSHVHGEASHAGRDRRARVRRRGSHLRPGGNGDCVRGPNARRLPDVHHGHHDDNVPETYSGSPHACRDRG